MFKTSEFAAIDPLALLLPSSVYVKVVEKLHPHVPKVADVRDAARDLSAPEKQLLLSRARTLSALAKVVEEALG
jgi:hypothetical protein